MLDVAYAAGSTHLDTQQIDSPVDVVKIILRKESLRRSLETLRLASGNLLHSATKTMIGPSFHLDENPCAIVGRNNVYFAFTRPEVGFGDFVAQFLRHKNPGSGFSGTSDSGWESQFSA